MRVAIAGAGAVGRSIAQALLDDGHKVLLIERERASYRPHLVPDADWMLADACEAGTLQAAGIAMCDVVMAATGDDKANMVFALLAKTECHVPRVVARVNNTGNQWLFTQDWGVDVAVSTPNALVAAVEEAVTVGDIVRLMTLREGGSNLIALTLPDDSALIGTTVGELQMPTDAALLTILRSGTVVTPNARTQLLAGDELVLAVGEDSEAQVRQALTGQPL
ncbi:MAG TPA: TrkA family potassium uptake protein [Jatrophihabitantaceae bacterium]|nr:TrkA family potassium uptake protein [Jatrophihabitantaceae bacterium]